MTTEPVLRDYGTRKGVGRQSDAERFEDEIIRLARDMCLVATTSELSAQYAPAVNYLVKARRALREAFDK